MEVSRKTIQVALRRIGSEVEIVVIDQGAGIPVDIMGRLFVSKISSEKRSGKGVGLLLARAILQRHNGSIGIAATGANGTQVVIRLPSL